MKKAKELIPIIQIDLLNLPSLDWSLSLKLASGKEKLAKYLHKIMIQSLPKKQELINLAFNTNAFLDLREHIHKLYGGCCYTGFIKLKYIAKALEHELARHRNISSISKVINYTKVKQHVNLINQEIIWLISNNVIK